MLRVADNSTLTVRQGRSDELAEIRSLLERNGLPTADLGSAQPDFVVVRDASKLVGVGALEWFSDCALLRSLAVAPDRRNAGVGQLIVQHLENLARGRRATALVLLTQSATRFFESRGYQVVDRANAPASVQASAEFRTLCPASADCMIKVLHPAEASAAV